MKRPQKHLWTEAALWLIAEIFLNLSGMDTLADYSEFLLSQRTLSHTSYLSSSSFMPVDQAQNDIDAIECQLIISLSVTSPENSAKF